MSRSFKLSPIWAAMLFIGATNAQQMVTAPETLVVTANRTPAQISEIPGTVWVVDGEDIRAQVDSGTDFKDALAQLIPSLDPGSQGRTNAGQQMRGRSVLVMLDGVSLNSSRGISRQFESIDPFNIERIEVISGATSIYGGDSSGGIVNIITKKGEAGDTAFEAYVGGKSGLNGGEDFDGKFAGAIKGGNDTGDYRVSLAYAQTQAFYNADGNKILPDITQTSSQYGKQIDVMASGGLNLAEAQRLEFTAQYFNNEQDSDSGAHFGPMYAGFKDPSQVSVKEGLVLDNQPKTERTYLGVKYANQAFLGQSLYLQGYYRDEEMQFYPFPRINSGDLASSTISASNQRTRVYGLKAVMVSELSDLSTQLVYGVDADREEFEADQQYYDFMAAAQSGGLVYNPSVQTDRYPNVDVDQLAAFLQAKVNPTDDLTITAGVRFQYSNATIPDFVDVKQQYKVVSGQLASADAVPGGEADYNETLFNLGAIYDFDNPHQVFVNFAQAFDVPDPAKYYGVGTYDGSGNLQKGISIADNKASGIRTDSYEAGWRYAGEALNSQVSAYYSLSDSRIKNSTKRLTVTQVDEDKRVYGIEAQVNYALAQDWFMGVNGHLVRTEINSDGEWKKETVMRASTDKLAAHIGWNPNELALRLQGMQIFDYEDEAKRKLEGYFVADLLGSYELPTGKLNFGINNLFNENYETIWSQRAQPWYVRLTDPAVVTFQGRGRTYSVSYSLDF